MRLNIIGGRSSWSMLRTNVILGTEYKQRNENIFSPQFRNYPIRSDNNRNIFKIFRKNAIVVSPTAPVHHKPQQTT